MRTAEQVGRLLWGSRDLEIHDIVVSMSVVRSSRWRIKAKSIASGEWLLVYEGPHFANAVHAVQDHDEVRVFYLHGDWNEVKQDGDD